MIFSTTYISIPLFFLNILQFETYLLRSCPHLVAHNLLTPLTLRKISEKNAPGKLHFPYRAQSQILPFKKRTVVINTYDPYHLPLDL